jgi:rsbT co-antagonist protein RsbR
MSDLDAAAPWSPQQSVADLLRQRREQIAQRWADLPLFRSVFTVTRDEAVEAAQSVADALVVVAASGRVDDIEASGFDSVRTQIGRMSAARSRAGLSVGRVAGEVAALKDAVVDLLTAELAGAPIEHQHAAVLYAAELLSTLRLVAMQTMFNEGQELINRQRQQLMEVATPVIKLWHGVVAVPLIGTLDSARSQVVMENLLDAIVAQQARVAILDVTGVATVDTLVAQHLLKTVASARLMGAECIITGIRPAIAQTIVQLGIDLSDVATRSTLADALGYALDQGGLQVRRTDGRTVSAGESR